MCGQGLAPNYYSVTLPMVKTMPTAVARMLRAIFTACALAKSVRNVLLSVMWVQELQLEVPWRLNAVMAAGAVWVQTKLHETGWCILGAGPLAAFSGRAEVCGGRPLFMAQRLHRLLRAESGALIWHGRCLHKPDQRVDKRTAHDPGHLYNVR